MAHSQKTLDTSGYSRTSADTITISTLRRRRGNIIGQITSFQKQLDQFPESQNTEYLQVALESLENYWSKFDDVQTELEIADNSEEPKRFEIQNTYFLVVANARKILHSTKKSITSVPATQSQSSLNTTQKTLATRLPEILLPTFDGISDDWNSFYDQFSVIDQNQELTASQKLRYLRSALKGKASSCIASLPTTDSNYASALEILKHKFDCRRKIILRHCDALHEYPKLSKDTRQALSNLVDFYNQHLRALENLEQPISSWNAILVSIILSKVNTNTVWHWQLSLKNKEVPSYTALLNFLEERADCAPIQFSTPNPITTSDNRNPHTKQITNKSAPQKQLFLTQMQSCPVCKEPHRIWMCNNFKTLSAEERYNTIKRFSLCSNCLGEGHSQINCRSSSCRVCQKRHHTLLHKTGPSTSNNHHYQHITPAANESVELPIKQQTKSFANLPTKQHYGQEQSSFVVDVATNELLVTATINVINDNNKLVTGRVLIDTGSTTNFMTEDFAKTLGLPMRKCHVPVGALNSLNTVSKHTITATIKSKVYNYEKTLSFLTIPQISSLVPNQPIDRTNIQIPHNIILADPNFHKPAPIDMLLGSGTALSLLAVGQINLTNLNTTDLYLQKTQLGWVIGGSVPARTKSRPQVHVTTTDLHDISKFWEIEDGPQETHLSADDVACETHFTQNTVRDQNGRYIVALPFNSKQSQLGESHSQALTRFAALERRFKRDPQFKQDYHKIISEYLILGHLSPEEQNTQYDGYYLPHHAVLKSSSLTTKMRVVFDGSSKTSTGISLNDTLYAGPKLQDDLIYILLRFRIHQYVLTGDVEKMYRQFFVRTEDRKYQKILWRDNEGTLKTYTLNTVTFGLAAAPFLAIRCLRQLADDESNNFPTAAKIIKRDFYVDDALTGFSTIQEGVAIREELKHILKSGGLNMRQWASNDKRLLKGLPEEDINKHLQLGEQSSLKTLGVIWNADTDSIHYTVKITNLPKHISKRIICSEIAKIYDPLGLLGPVIITAKLMLQKLWTLKIDWDESLPTEIHSAWIDYYNKLPLLNNLTFPRHTLGNESAHIELHGFCDASTKAYGASIYLRSITQDGMISTHLLIAKSKVAPLKQQTIPRLELCGALLLSSLTTTVKKALPINIKRIILWTDSTIVLHWLHTSPHLLKTFVGNRVSEIHRNTKVDYWRHVRTLDNPADLISRGITAEEFLSTSIWYSGPKWLHQNESQWPTLKIIPKGEPPEQKKQRCLSLSTSKSKKTISYERYSSWIKLQRIIAYCLRWQQKGRKGAPLTAPALEKSKRIILRHIQQNHFHEEIACLTGGRNIQPSSSLLRLNPFIDKDRLLRVGGRLQNSELSFTQKHQIILPKDHVTDLIIVHQHKIQLHSGVQATLYGLRQEYWPINGRSAVWKITKACITCCRYNPPPVQYIMGNLPDARVTASRPFTHVGIDYCGPFYIKERRYRNRAKVKAYVAIFICLAVKAVHLELVGDMTTESFIGALRRFMARRGFCNHIYSDNGSNFVGANNELQE